VRMILVYCFKPADTEEWNKSLMDEIDFNIKELINVSRELQR
jgi:hypothetical protein